MTAIIGRSKFYYHTIMTGIDCMTVGFTSTYYGCHGHDCMIVGCTSSYGGCHGHDYNGSLIVIFNRLRFFFVKSCDALIFVVRLRFLILNNENAWLL
jgi:hypothetical protein